MTKRLFLKLGTECNLGCPHCHQAQKSFIEHPNLVNWIKQQNFYRIAFSGGEPLIYFDIIKRIMLAVGKNTHYRIMTNGTLLTEEMAKFFSEYTLTFGVSYDGEAGGRDLSLPIQWENLKFLKGWGLSTTYSTPSFSFKEFKNDIKKLCKQHAELGGKLWTHPEFLKINWIHQTEHAPNKEFTKEIADSYIEQMELQIDKALYCFDSGAIGSNTLKNLIKRWVYKHTFQYGVACCSDLVWNINLDGTVMLCPYGNKIIGTIDNLPSEESLNAFIPNKCKNCEFWKICGCSCVASISGLDCYVNKKMIPKVQSLIAKYGLEKRIEELFS